MKAKNALLLLVVGLMSAWFPVVRGDAQAQEPPKIKIPESGVPQIMTMEGKFVRASYNNEGYVIIGYQLANRSVGEEWMLLEAGVTVLDRTPNQKFKRDAISLDTPDGKTIPLATLNEHREGNTTALQNREKVQRDSINYFPPTASRACGLTFFPELNSRVMPVDEVELSKERACLGRLYFKIPGGIKYGQHWVNVKFEKSLIRVPFKILTKDEEKLLDKNYKSISKQVKEAFKPKKKS